MNISLTLASMFMLLIGLLTYPFAVEIEKLVNSRKMRVYWWIIVAFGVSWFISGIAFVAEREYKYYVLAVATGLTVIIIRKATKIHAEINKRRKNVK